jgi:pimeloyl-ACP methyl ester carboxylesterase
MRFPSSVLSSRLAFAFGLALQAWIAPGVVAATPTAEPSKPVAGAPQSVVLVHGAWADGSSWNAVIPLLQAKGLKVVAVQLPLTSLADDVGAVRRAIERQGGPVLLVGHSWGGVVVTEIGRHAQVAGLVYIAAFAPGQGESVQDLLSDKSVPPPPGLAGIEPDAEGFLWHTADNIAQNFAQDIPSAQARLIGATQKPIARASFGSKVGVPAWSTKPNWYVVAERDRMLPPEAQRFFAGRMKAKVTALSSGHNPMLSQPTEVAAVILDAAREPGR